MGPGGAKGKRGVARFATTDLPASSGVLRQSRRTRAARKDSPNPSPFSRQRLGSAKKAQKTKASSDLEVARAAAAKTAEKAKTVERAAASAKASSDLQAAAAKAAEETKAVERAAASAKAGAKSPDDKSAAEPEKKVDPENRTGCRSRCRCRSGKRGGPGAAGGANIAVWRARLTRRRTANTSQARLISSPQGRGHARQRRCRRRPLSVRIRRGSGQGYTVAPRSHS